MAWAQQTINKRTAAKPDRRAPSTCWTRSTLKTHTVVTEVSWHAHSVHCNNRCSALSHWQDLPVSNNKTNVIQQLEKSVLNVLTKNISDDFECFTSFFFICAWLFSFSFYRHFCKQKGKESIFDYFIKHAQYGRILTNLNYFQGLHISGFHGKPPLQSCSGLTFMSVFNQTYAMLVSWDFSF